jgi:hypothetical protein
VQSLMASPLAILSWLELAMRESKTLGDGKVAKTRETLTSREESLRPCQSTAGVIAEASTVPPNLEVVTVTFSPAFMRLMLTPRATL